MCGITASYWIFATDIRLDYTTTMKDPLSAGACDDAS
jgi:hypothetical protein